MSLLKLSMNTQVAGKLLNSPAVAGVGNTITGVMLNPVMIAHGINKPFNKIVSGLAHSATPKGKMYGKRGLDANRLNTSNLVQNMYKTRRK